MLNQCSKCQTTSFKKLTEGFVFGSIIKHKNCLPNEFPEIKTNVQGFFRGIKLQICNKCIKKQRLNEFKVMMIILTVSGLSAFLGFEFEIEWLGGIGLIIGLACLSAIPISWQKDNFFADTITRNFVLDLLPKDIRHKEYGKIYTISDLFEKSEEDFENLCEEDLERIKNQEHEDFFKEMKTAKKNEKISRRNILGIK